MGTSTEKKTGSEQIFSVQGWVNFKSVNRVKFTSALIYDDYYQAFMLMDTTFAGSIT